jgi:hypothetical protein
MTRTSVPFQGKPYVLHSEEARWFAHRLFGRSEGGAGPAEGEADWRRAGPSPKQAA